MEKHRIKVILLFSINKGSSGSLVQQDWIRKRQPFLDFYFKQFRAHTVTVCK